MFGSERRLIIILKYKIDHQEKHWNFQNILYGSSAIDLSQPVSQIYIDQSNKVKTSDKQMHVAFCDNNGYCQISSDKLERRSNKLIRVRSICCLTLVFTTQSTIWQSCQYVKYGQQYVKKKKKKKKKKWNVMFGYETGVWSFNLCHYNCYSRYFRWIQVKSNHSSKSPH